VISGNGNINITTRLLLLLLFCTGMLSACKWLMPGSEFEEEALARVGTAVLKRKDLTKYLPLEFVEEEDSLRNTRLFIEQWVMEQILTDQALGEIDGLEEKIEFKVRDYRNKLILNEYYNYLIHTRLDTVVDSLAIQQYYDKHLEKFIATETRYLYVFIGTHLLEVRKPIQLLANKPSLIPFDELQEWCRKNAFVCQTDTLNWVHTEEIDAISSTYYGRLKELRPGHYPVSWTGTYEDKPANFIFKMIQVIPTGEVLPQWMLQETLRQGVILERTRKLIEIEKIRLKSEAEKKGGFYVR